MKNLNTITRSVLVLVAAFAININTATSGTITTFDRVETNSSHDLSTQFSVDYSLTDATTEYADGSLVGAGLGVAFTFYNTEAITASSITDIYFDTGDEGPIFSDVFLGESTVGVDFEKNASPAELNGNGGIGFYTDYSAQSTSPTEPNGIGDNEWLTLIGLFTVYDNGTTDDIDDMLAALLSGQFRIGLRVQGIYDLANCPVDDLYCESDSYVSGPPGVVPVPAAAWLFGTALFGFFAASRRKKIS